MTGRTGHPFRLKRRNSMTKSNEIDRSRYSAPLNSLLHYAPGGELGKISLPTYNYGGGRARPSKYDNQFCLPPTMFPLSQRSVLGATFLYLSFV